MELYIIKLTKSQREKAIFFLATFLFSMINFSCQKYLDIKKSSSISLIQTANDCQLMLDNYSLMNTGYPSDGEASADDYFLSDAGYLSPNNGLAQTDLDLYVWANTAMRPDATPQWKTPYQIIYQTNLVLEAVDKIKSDNTDPAATPATLATLRGSALFFRAFAFWQVAQLYTRPYASATASQDPGIPLPVTSDVNDKYPRGTVSQTYARIVQDLLEAVNLLPPTSSLASRPNKAAAYAQLARTYLSMEDYPNALINANATLQLNNQLMDFNTLSTISNIPFSPRFNKEVIFQAVMAPDPALKPGSAPSNVAKVDSVLVTTYQTNDLRKMILLKPNSGVDEGTFRFTGNYEPTTTATLFDGLAVDEMYLIRAEGYARAGNITAAMTNLNTLLSTRWKTGTYIAMTATSADDALAKILTERRKELLMRGLRWTDLRRLNKDSRFAKTLSRSRPTLGVTYKLPPNDPRYTLLIPQEVVINGGYAQNSH